VKSKSYCVYEHREELTRQLEIREDRCLRNMSTLQMEIHKETIRRLLKRIDDTNDIIRVLDSIDELTTV